MEIIDLGEIKDVNPNILTDTDITEHLKTMVVDNKNIYPLHWFSFIVTNKENEVWKTKLIRLAFLEDCINYKNTRNYYSTEIFNKIKEIENNFGSILKIL
jgi:hypothetical protein